MEIIFYISLPHSWAVNLYTMNIYARYFDHDILAHSVDELIDFLSHIPDIHINDDLVNDIRSYVESDIVFPKRYKIRPRVYFILIKTEADTIESFKANKKEGTPSIANEAQNRKEQRINLLTQENPGWYKGTINFKRVIQIPQTGKFQYEDTKFSALVKAASGQECYNRIIAHLKGRQDVDLRSQFPSAKGNNFEFERVADLDATSKESI